jgi:DNA-binding GntR family transcriptional regulator
LILDRELRPGERTSVNLLAGRLGIGRTPIKEAITRLQTEGVLSVVGRSGTTVRSLGAQETQQLFALRKALEAFAAVEAVKNATPAKLQELRKLRSEMRLTSCVPGKKDSIARFVRANVAFHAGIVAAAGNPFLDRLYSQLQMQAQITTYLLQRGHDPQSAEAAAA